MQQTDAGVDAPSDPTQGQHQAVPGAQSSASHTGASPELTGAVFDQLPLPVVLIEPDGTILAASRRWTRPGEILDDSAPLRAVGGNYFHTVEHRTPAADAAQLRERLLRLSSGDAEEVRIDLPSELDGEDVWLQVRASRVDRSGVMIVTHTDVTSHMRALHSASWEAQHDHLTQLPNRGQLHAVLEAALRTQARQPVALLFIDIDEFKKINDHYGHDVGDDLLRAIAVRLQEGTRTGDIVARLGGDEFVVLTHPSPPADAQRLERRLRAAFDEPFRCGTDLIPICISIGLATATAADDVRRLLRRADLAMYADKRLHRVSYVGAPDVSWNGTS